MKTIKKTSLLTGALVAGALFTASTSNAKSLLDFDYLGTGGELRSQLLSDSDIDFSKSTSESLKSIEGACGDKKMDSTKTSKVKDAKCGEGKCGDKKTDKKKDKKADKKAKKAESKSKDMKCGEGKCGDKKPAK